MTQRITPEQQAMLHAQGITVRATGSLLDHFVEAWMAGFRYGLQPAESHSPLPSTLASHPPQADPNALVYGEDQPFTPPGIPTEPGKLEDPSSWRPVIHANGPGACQRIAFYVTRKVSRHRNGKVRWLRYLNGMQPKPGDPQVCGTCGAEIIYWSQRFVDWTAHFLTDSEEAQLEQERQRKDPRSTVSLQDQHRQLQDALAPLAGELPNMPSLPSLNDLAPNLVNIVGPVVAPEPEIPYMPYPAGVDPAAPTLPRNNDPWNNIGIMMQAAEAVLPAPPQDLGLPPDHPDMQEPLPDLPTDAIFEMALQHSRVDSAVSSPIQSEDHPGEPLAEDSSEVAAQED